ncbi:predicted protein [Verticillium alfalfae VaMs.102]|uniref:Predicted protein n=1 Tax=Verticillium alfalfae (strain VaMs.102 / ATCC MYA-4576 / FGSC 10136) TaxID=526221 RepID=C9S5R1_VERA1|nr:predicted protein [Verticillium alfalfae VaMs.102]EEY14287.1 predicted protein [Verticillium alfalfae VaMs.102]
MEPAPQSTNLWSMTAGASNTTIVLPPQDEASTPNLSTITIGIVGLFLTIATITIAWRQYLQQRHPALPPARATIALNDMAGQVPATPSSPIQNDIRRVDHPSSETSPADLQSVSLSRYHSMGKSILIFSRTPDEHQSDDNE